MAKIIGNPTITPMAVPDWRQTNELKADFIRNKPTKLSEFENDIDSIPSIVYTEIDNFLDGVCKIVPKPEYNCLNFEERDGKYDFYDTDTDIRVKTEMCALCLSYQIENIAYNDHYCIHYQMLIFADNRIYSRNRICEYDDSTGECVYGDWGAWNPYTVELAQRANRDYNGRKIHDTYATKEEFKDKHTWKLLGETTVTEANVTDAGEDGVTSIAIDCGDLSGYDELRINLQCGVNDANADLSNANYRLFSIGILQDMNETIGDDDNRLIFDQGSGEAALRHTYINNVIINSYFSEGILQYSEILNNNYSSHNYRTTPSVALPNLTYKLIGTAAHAKIGHPVDLKKGKRIVLFQCRQFKFPAGTELKVYGR